MRTSTGFLTDVYCILYMCRFLYWRAGCKNRSPVKMTFASAGLRLYWRVQEQIFWLISALKSVQVLHWLVQVLKGFLHWCVHISRKTGKFVLTTDTVWMSKPGLCKRFADADAVLMCLIEWLILNTETLTVMYAFDDCVYDSNANVDTCTVLQVSGIECTLHTLCEYGYKDFHSDASVQGLRAEHYIDVNAADAVECCRNAMTACMVSMLALKL